jgi:ABC-type nickel/cobalt efflux system permease component RcnA
VKYALARLGIFVALALVLWPIPNLSPLLKLMIAILLSAVASWFLLKKLRDQVADRVEKSMERRLAEKEKLRKALAGDDTDAVQDK